VTAVTAPLRARVTGSVSAAVEDLGGRPAVVVRSDAARHRGAITAADGETLAEAARLALAQRMPFVAVLTTSGTDVGDGVGALHGWGRAAAALTRCSGLVPIVVVVTGPAVAGPALLLGLADLVVMTESSFAFLSGPQMVSQFTGVRIDADALGGSRAHAQGGVAALVAPDEAAALELVAAVLAHLPAHADEEPPWWPTTDPVDRPTPELADLMPATPTGAYDVRRVIEAVADEGDVLELWSDWAPNLVTALCTVGGRPVGVVANQPMALAGTLDIAASQKGAGFVSLCDVFGQCLLTLVDTPGYFPGRDLEWRGIIRKGAQLAFAYAEATVPRVSVVLRKAYGGAYIVMDSKAMGSDLCLAWPSAQVAVMGPQQAVQILHRSLDEAARAERVAEYEAAFLNPWVAAERGLVDMVIDPADTRRLVAACFDQLATKRERLPRRRHSNTPL